jgi:hypothetical protein
MNETIPVEILNNIQTISVDYVDFEGNQQRGSILIHTAVSQDVADFFAEAYKLRFPIHSVQPVQDEPFFDSDEKSCEANNSSGFNYRTITVGSALSKHAIGCAFDINPAQNPYLRFDAGSVSYTIPAHGTYDVSRPGTLTSTHPLVSMMKQKGWTWGGDWGGDSGRIDYQHFEIVPHELAHFLTNN